MIHVIVTAYNHEDFVGQCIDRILSQRTSEDFYVTVIDDASTDGTPIIIQELIQRSPIPIHLERSKHNYRNSLEHPVFKVMAQSPADFFAFCDGDDYWSDDFKLEKQLKLAHERPNIGLVHTNYSLLELGENGSSLRSLSSTQISKAEQTHSAFDLIQGNDIKHSTVLLRREFLDLDFLDGSENIIPKDWLMYVDILSKSQAAFINEVTTVHRVHKGGFWNGSLTKEKENMKDQVRWFCSSQLVEGELKNAFRNRVANDHLKSRISQSILYKSIRPLVLFLRTIRKRFRV